METKQVFKGRNLTRTKVQNKILKVWSQCTDKQKFDWYLEANKFAESISKQDKIKVCGIIAALSPLKRWEENMKLAKEFYLTQNCGHTKLHKSKALAIFNLTNPTEDEICAILFGKSGNKIKSFFINIWRPDARTEVTIDRHALAIALGEVVSEDEMKGMTTKQYNFFRDCYIRTADKIGVKPLLLQSATWVRWRELKKGK
jgi:hypothetical protein